MTIATWRARLPGALRLAAGLMCLATIVGTGAHVSAHPTALTHAQVTINRDRTIDVTFTTLADALVTKLEAIAGLRTDGDRSDATDEERIQHLRGRLIAQISVQADDTPVALRFAGISRVPDRPGKVAVRLSGTLPSGASRLRWSTALVAGSYPLAVRDEGLETPATDDAFEWLTGSEESRSYAIDSPHMSSQVRRFFRSIRIGFTHIVPKGLDHILFVLGLFLLATRTRTVLAQVTAFTVAHSITLGLSLYGLVRLPSTIVEPLIALSIVYVAFENIFTSTLTPWRLALVFAFGLLHGLGFAEALMALDLPRAEFLSTLVAFNLGVEAGQLSVILVAALALVAMRVPSADYRRLVVRPASIAIAMVGAFWMVERLFSI
jgi:HupE / UreJ protein